MSAEAVFDALEPVLTRWTMGGQGAAGQAAALAPPPWRDAVSRGDAVEQELRLLALSGQFLMLCVAPTPAGAVAPLADLPALALPLVPAETMPLLRRCLRAAKDAEGRRQWVHWLASRGYGVHPADWMPSRNDDAIPDAYAPWRDWADAQAGLGGGAGDPYDALTEANWHDWMPAARRIALTHMRQHDPAQATALLAAKAAGESADARLRLIECLQTGLSDGDIPYLQSLSADRAPKIKALAASMLARLGQGSGAAEDAAELAGFFEIQTKGLLRRTRILVPRAIKTPAQRNRRTALFAAVDCVSFADALDLTAEELVALWQWGKDTAADLAFAEQLTLTAAEPVVAATHATLVNSAEVGMAVLLRLKERWSAEQRTHIAARQLFSFGGRFADAVAIAGPGAAIPGLMASPAGQALKQAVFGDGQVADEIRCLALIASPGEAQAALEPLMQNGLSSADPQLDPLRLNAALPYQGVSV